MCITESLGCPPEANTTLEINYTSNKIFLIFFHKIYIYFIYFAHKSATWAEFSKEHSLLYSVSTAMVQSLEAGIIWRRGHAHVWHLLPAGSSAVAVTRAPCDHGFFCGSLASSQLGGWVPSKSIPRKAGKSVSILRLT